MSKIIVVLFLITSSGLEYKKMIVETDGTCFDAIDIAKNKISKHYWNEDNPKALECMKKLIDICQLSGYVQIKPPQGSLWGTEMAEIFGPLTCDKFKVVNLSTKKDVWPQFARLFGGKYEI